MGRVERAESPTKHDRATHKVHNVLLNRRGANFRANRHNVDKSHIIVIIINNSVRFYLCSRIAPDRRGE